MKKEIAYIINIFPFITHTFISREIRELKKLGIDILIFSINKPPLSKVSLNDFDFYYRTNYVFPIKIKKFLKSHLYFFLKSTYKYIFTLFYISRHSATSINSFLKSFFHFCEGVYIAYQIKHTTIDHIHVHFADGCATAAIVIKKLLNIGYSFTAHGSDILLNKLMIKEKIKNSEFIISISEYNRDIINNLVPNAKLKTNIVRCGLNLQKFNPISKKVKTNKMNFKILSIGSLRWQKGHKYLIEAINILNKNNFSLECNIIGEGPEKNNLLKLIKRYRLEGIIKLVGAVKNEQIHQYYYDADLFVLASLSEGIPVVLMEAMAYKVPVISTKITGIPELVKHMKNGILVEPRRANELCNSIKFLMFNDSLRHSFTNEAKRTIETNYNLNNNVYALKKIFDQKALNKKS